MVNHRIYSDIITLSKLRDVVQDVPVAIHQVSGRFYHDMCRGSGSPLSAKKAEEAREGRPRAGTMMTQPLCN